MRVLGVDPGLTRCGLGVVEGAPGRPPGLVAAGVARTAPTADIGARLLALEVEIDSWLAEHHPDAVAVERVFSQHNVRTVMGTAQAGAVAVLCAARRGLPVALHTPSEVKAAVTGSGRADKAQVTTMVMRLLRLADPPKPADTADALALAICHLWRGPQTRLGAAALLARGGDPPDPPSRCAPAAAGPRPPPVTPGRRRPAVISHLDGIVCAIAPEGAVIEVGGVGLLVQATPGTLAALRTGERARVATSLVVREDALTLYGFASDDERDVFELVQTASGVGPRLALAMLASFSPDGLRQAIAAEDVAALTRVPGIGRKGAQRIVLELAGRLGSPAAPAGIMGPPPGAGAAAGGAALWRDQVRAGLVNLGWPARDAEQAIAAVAADLGGGPAGDVDVSVALRAALRKLSRA